MNPPHASAITTATPIVAGDASSGLTASVVAPSACSPIVDLRDPP